MEILNWIRFILAAVLITAGLVFYAIILMMGAL